MKKSLFILLAASLGFAACQVVESDIPEFAEEVLFAQIEQDEVTKAVLDENGNILWSENDQIVAFMKTSYGHQYQIQSSFVGKTYANFSKISSVSGEDLSAGLELDHIVAYYPYAEGIECVKHGENYTLDVVLPAEQTYAAKSFGNGLFPMVAVSEDNNITFKNVCGGMMLQLKGTQKVISITVQGKNNEVLSGAATVIAYTDETKPFITLTGTDAACKSVKLNCGTEGVQLNESIATEFIIAIPPVVFREGFVVIITDSEANEQIVKSDRENEVLRSSLLVMPEVTLENPMAEVPAGEYVNLSQSGTANSYILSKQGKYMFSTVKGDSYESVGAVSSAEVLWESFGTDVTPNIGDLVKNVVYSDGYIAFQTADTFKEGNAVIAAKDANGTILWSWHIWMTDQPEGQVYYNDAGIMMDRNLGATSATPGDVGALGLLYQWGRKDPFLGSSSISNDIEAKSTITWPSAVSSDSSNGTIAYAIANPTSFIKYNSKNIDWYYTGDLSTDDTRWTTSETNKSIYDPCPAGWRVPDGGNTGVWAKAIGSSSNFDYTYNSTDKGMNFSGKFGSSSTIWYPASGRRHFGNGSLDFVGLSVDYWSASPYDFAAYRLYFNNNGSVDPSGGNCRAYGNSVRCLQE